jgi:hypothetical protein
VTSVDRDFVLLVDGDSGALTATDNRSWPTLRFERVAAGEYIFRRNEAPVDANAVTYEYRLTVDSRSEIHGEGRFFLPGEDCALLIEFTMTLVDETVICMVNTEVAANLRAGPGTEFERAGTIPVVDLQPVIGQAESGDGFTWWQLGEASWVRSDVVSEAGDCAALAVTG